MPNLGHSIFLPGRSLGGPIDVKGWKATTRKKFWRSNEEYEFRDEFSSKQIMFRTFTDRRAPTFRGRREQWPTKFSRSLKKLAWSSLSDYSLMFAFSEIEYYRECRNEFGWPELLVADWIPEKVDQLLKRLDLAEFARPPEKLCVAMSVIDFTKEESDFSQLRDAKQTDAIAYAKNMLSMFLDERKDWRLMNLGNGTSKSILAATQEKLEQGPPTSELIYLFTEGEEFLWNFEEKGIKCCVSATGPTKLQNLNAQNLPTCVPWPGRSRKGCGCMFGGDYHNGAKQQPPTCPVSSQALMAITGPGAKYSQISNEAARRQQRRMFFDTVQEVLDDYD
jgi:hypothetical protein